MQNPHWSAWCSVNACWSSFSSPAGPASDSTVSTERPWVWIGEHQARADRLAVDQDVAAPAEAVLAGDVRPLQAEVVA